MVDAPTVRVTWTHYHRLINSAYPPIDLFEDIAGPSDWGLLGVAEARTNPRVADTIGNLDLVPKDRRVGGDGASYVMAPFTHISLDRVGRFHDGTFGVFYAADSFDVALFETVYHMQIFYAATAQKAGWLTDFRELTGDIDADLVDICGDEFGHLLAPGDYGASQTFARDIRANGADGIVYSSVRSPGGICFGAFYPDVMSVPMQGKHVRYHWDGARIDMIQDLDGGDVFVIED